VGAITPNTDEELYRRGCATLVASWQEYARGARGASLRHLPGVATAVFPHGAEREVYNNALFDRELDPPRRARAVTALQEAYRAAGVTAFAGWAHETDSALREDLDERGYTSVECTRVMGMDLSDLYLARPCLRVEPLTWADYLGFEGLPAEFIAGADHAALHPLAALLDGQIAAAALAYDHDGDCGIYNVGTAPWARRRGLATALTTVQLWDARERGCHTASLQSTPMAERVYLRIGFRDLGRFIEYAPPTGPGRGARLPA
jgi:ribosomal protein S18 acetylase RimI-like enzyme